MPSSIHTETGNRAKAQDHLTTAAALYRQMDMGFWLTRAESTLAEAG